MKQPIRLAGALLTPTGVYVIEYRRRMRGLDVQRHAKQNGIFPIPADAARAVVGQLAQHDTSPAQVRVAAVAHGFGSSFHPMQLPRARREVLDPVVRREIARLFPELESPDVAYAPIQRRGQLQDFAVAAMPQRNVQALVTSFDAHGVELEHLTVLPRAVQRMYDELDGGSQTTALICVLQAGLFIGLFHEGVLRQGIVPPAAQGVPLVDQVPTVLEQLARADLYLRQQFRGAAIEHVLVTSDGSTSEIMDALRRDLSVDVEAFGQDLGPASAIVALGAVLDAQSETPLSLLAATTAQVAKRQRVTRNIVIASAVVLATAAVWWAGSGYRSNVVARERIAVLQDSLTRHIDAISAMRATIDRRQAHAQRLLYVDSIQAQQEHLQNTIEAIARATPSDVHLTSLQLRRAGADWKVVIEGQAAGYSTAEAVRAVNLFYQALPEELPARNVTVDNFDYTVASANAVQVARRRMGVRFKISLVAGVEQAQ